VIAGNGKNNYPLTITHYPLPIPSYSKSNFPLFR
jgi:hypothetical protein